MSELAEVKTLATVMQEQLFTFKMTKPAEGAVSLAHTREIPLAHPQTADLCKRPELGIGQVVSFVGGTGTIKSFRRQSDRITWTVEVDDLQIEL